MTIRVFFSEWDVVYCSIPTSPGGGYRSALGRLFFKTKEMIQAIKAPDTVLNKVSIRAFGFLDGEVSLKGMPSTILLYEMEYPYLYVQWYNIFLVMKFNPYCFLSISQLWIGLPWSSCTQFRGGKPTLCLSEGSYNSHFFTKFMHSWICQSLA